VVVVVPSMFSTTSVNPYSVASPAMTLLIKATTDSAVAPPD
jgi:hypothetical protein